ncbi:MAG: hypothetical protein PWP49_296 [Thermococcaceae archaeon]|nr:hypothetical protein [Thermococcus sp. PK]KUJ99651.1 MAG: hypothetical protein XD43_0679 [Thermococcales archaeon 44_46]MDK2783972.1 hypothetical protein [Thermococcaceae archaeon]MDK2853535.1 hypothetical protein [Thermococcaceae archaeon]MDK2983173.1 hypothetical protein [Thermococcaceae archaeon]MDN5319876.1 hypothetical protein [Thermococcaceae archaeon]
MALPTVPTWVVFVLVVIGTFLWAYSIEYYAKKYYHISEASEEK